MRFTKHDDGTVTDTQTGLTWSKTLAKDVTHEKAMEYAQRVHALAPGESLDFVAGWISSSRETQQEKAYESTSSL